MDPFAYECDRCGIHLPLKTQPEDWERLHVWRCRNCGKRAVGVFDDTARVGIRKNAERTPPLAPQNRRLPLGSFAVLEFTGPQATR